MDGSIFVQTACLLACYASIMLRWRSEMFISQQARQLWRTEIHTHEDGRWCPNTDRDQSLNETSRNNEFNIDGKMLIFPCFILLFADLTVAENSNSSKKVHWLILHYHKTGGFQFSLQSLLPSIRVRTSPFYHHLIPFHFSSMVACMFQVMIWQELYSNHCHLGYPYL